MKISTKGRYGLRAMTDLALNSVTNPVALKNIAERQKISESYLEQVFSTLKKAGLVKSIKGSQGGYLLADRESKITVGSILRALEGNLSVIDNKPDPSEEDNKLEYCIRTNIWEAIDKSINLVVDSITLEEIVFEYKKTVAVEANMYYI